MIPLALFALAACLAVSPASDQVLAGDLAAQFPEWSAVPPATALGFAPAPGVLRVFRSFELRRFAERWNLTLAPDREICVTRPVAPVSGERLLAAMRKELPAAHIELLDFSRQPAPEGDLVFPASGLRQGSAGGYWNGFVSYGGTHHFTLWARVKVLVAAPRVIAAQDLKPGVVLDAGLLRLETREEIPVSGFAATLEDVAGKTVHRAVQAGSALRAEWLEEAKVVQRGDTVNVEAVRGAARISMECQAEGSGAIGEIISIHNPISKRSFPARIEAKGKVVATKGTL